MYVIFPIAVRTELELEKRYAERGGVNAVVVKLRLPDGSMYKQDGKIDYIEPTVSANTDTIVIRAKIPNPKWGPDRPGEVANRTLTDGEFVTVLVEGIEPVSVLGVPRAAVLSDQQGNYVYVVDSQNHAQQRRVQLGQSTPDTAVIVSGLTEGEMVVVDGIQRVRPGIQVTPGPAYPGPAAAAAGGNAPGPQASGAGGGPAAASVTSPSSPTPTSGSPAGSAPGSGGSAGSSSGH
jgi:membrane fusion protein (multidrug efflux system)